jgi:hypothetical protein
VVHGRLRPSGFGAPGRRGGPRRQVECSRDGREDRSAFAAPPCARSPLLAPVRPLKSVSGDPRPSGLYGYMSMYMLVNFTFSSLRNWEIETDTLIFAPISLSYRRN